MKGWLFDILKNATLVDNQTYCADNAVLTNRRFTAPISLERREGKKRTQVWNDEGAIWRFLNVASREIQELPFRHAQSALVLFNDKEYEHNSDIFFFDVSGVDCMNFTLKTGNVIGYLKKGAYSIKISSRFGDNFLKHIIADADGFLEIDNYGGASSRDEGYEWLLVYLWKTKLKKAFRLGLPKTYVAVNERSNKVKGSINPIDYFLNGRNTGLYQCEYRQHSYDNDATRLIADTFRKIGTHEFVQDATLLKNAFYTATNGKQASKRELHATKYFTNPFYKDYNEVIDLSKCILKDELTDFGEQSNSSAFFFDISMLFEYFIRKLLKRSGYTLDSKFQRRVEIATGVNNYKRKLEPDIVFSHNGRRYLFDVKYKSFDFIYGVSREDLFQLHTYLGQCGNDGTVQACGFIYPLSEVHWEKLGSSQSDSYTRDSIHIMGAKVDFYVLFIKVPDDNSNTFHSEFSNTSQDFINAIKAISES